MYHLNDDKNLDHDSETDYKSIGYTTKNVVLLGITRYTSLQGDLSIVELIRNKFPYNFMYGCVLLSDLYLQ